MYKRIIILGASGSGKSTLAKKIADYTGYPLFHLDELFQDNKWNMIDKASWPELSQIFLKQETGVVDGNYGSNMPLRAKWADLIIFIDTPTWLQLFRIIKRFLHVRFAGGQRAGMPDGNKEVITFKFFLWVLNWNRTRRNKTLKTLEEHAKDKKVIIINKVNGLDLESLFV